MSTTKVTDSMRDVTVVDAAKITTGTIPEARITTLTATKLTGTIADARISASSVNAHVDLSSVRQDIAMLALYNAVSDNRAAYNLPNSFIDQFEDDTGTTTRTDVSNVSEYFASVYELSGAFVADAYTSLLIHSDSTNGNTTFTDSSSTAHTLSTQGTISHSTTITPKIGATSIAFNGSNGLTLPWNASIQFNADFTLECWLYCPASLVTGDRIMSHWPNHASSNGGQWFIRATSDEADAFNFQHPSSGAHSTSGEYFNTSAWNHVAVQRDGSNITVYINGTNRLDEAMQTGTTGDQGSPSIGFYNGGSPTEFCASGYYIDEIRWSKGIARYTSTFTPQEDTSAASATGTLISDQQTASALTKMSGVVLVKDGGSSSTVMGTHLKIYFCATGTAASFPSAWVEAASYTAVTAPFSTGVTMYKLGETTVPSGTNPTIRAVWASQTSGGFESQLHGWAMNY